MTADRSIINGWLNVFKEQGYTSSHIVRTLKKRFNIKKTLNNINPAGLYKKNFAERN